MKHRILFYAIKELQARKEAALAIFSVMMACILVLINIYLFSYGSHLALVKEQSDRYHIRLTELNQNEVDAIQSLNYVESIRTVKRSDGIIAYIHLKNNAPALLKPQCIQIIKDVPLDIQQGELSVLVNSWINQQYYELAITPHFIQILSTYLLLFLLSCVSIGFTLQIKNLRSAKEYSYMLTMGLRKRQIICITLTQVLLIFFISFFAALVVGISLFKLISVFTAYAYRDNYVGVIFSVPWIDIFILFVGFLLSVSLFQVIHMLWLLRQDITDLIHERKTLVLSFMSRSSKRIEQPDKIKAYCGIYETRCIHGILRGMGKSIVLFALPILLMILSISYNESRAFTDKRTAWLSPADGRITETVVEQIQSLPSVEKITKGKIYDDGSYMFLNIYSIPGAEQECADQIEGIANQYALLYANIYQEKIVLTAQANFFAPYFLFQSILMFACGLLIVGADLRYELHTRREEFAVIRAVGYPVSALRQLLKSYPRRGILGYGMAAAGMFGFMGFAFQIWPTELMLYPFIVVIGFGVLDFVVHDRICRKCIKQIEEEEISAVLAGE